MLNEQSGNNTKYSKIDFEHLSNDERDKIVEEIKKKSPCWNKGWTKKQFGFLLKNYKNMTAPKMSKIIKKSVSSINHKLLRLGLYKPKKFHSEWRMGKGNPFYGKHHTKEAREKIKIVNSVKKPEISKIRKKMFKEGKLQPPIKKGQTIESAYGKETAKKIKENLRKKVIELYSIKDKEGKSINNPMYGKKHKKKSKVLMGIKSKAKWQNKEWVEKALKTFEIKPNKKELKLKKLIEENDMPINYVGDGKIWFVSKDGAFNPDFLSKDLKCIIELFGDYWHNLPGRKERDKLRLKTYLKYGYKTLVIWEHELKDLAKVINKIRKFIE